VSGTPAIQPRKRSSIQPIAAVKPLGGVGNE